MWALIFTLWCLSKLMWAGTWNWCGRDLKLMWAGTWNWCGRDLKLMWAGTWNWCGRGPETKMQVGMALANYVCWRAHPVNMFSSSNVTTKPLVTIGKKVPITCTKCHDNHIYYNSTDGLYGVWFQFRLAWLVSAFMQLWVKYRQEVLYRVLIFSAKR